MTQILLQTQLNEIFSEYRNIDEVTVSATEIKGQLTGVVTTETLFTCVGVNQLRRQMLQIQVH